MTDVDRDEAMAKGYDRHPNAEKTWTDDEDQVLLDAYRDGASIADLARQHERSQSAVTQRLSELGEDLGAA